MNVFNLNSHSQIQFHPSLINIYKHGPVKQKLTCDLYTPEGIDCRFLAVFVLERAPKSGIHSWLGQKYFTCAECTTLNAIPTVLLVISYFYIRKRKVPSIKTQPHSLYPLYRFFLSLRYFSCIRVETTFPKNNPMRPFYWSCCPHLIYILALFCRGLIFVSRVDKSG